MNSPKDTQVDSIRLFAFPTDLGWMALLHDRRLIQKISMAHESEVAAIRSIIDDSSGFGKVHVVKPNREERKIARQFQLFAAGKNVSFAGMQLDLSRLTRFQKKVLNLCRSVPYGRTLTYGQLATKAGSPRGARAVGNAMKNNPFPIVVPCHRIVAGNGIGGFSAPTGRKLKYRLLELEGVLESVG